MSVFVFNMAFKKGNIPWNKNTKGLQISWNQKEKIKVVCPCGVNFSVVPSMIACGKGKYHNTTCAGIARRGKDAWNKGLTREDPRVAKYMKKTKFFVKNDPRITGENNTNFPGGAVTSMWKGGRHMTVTGYITITKNKKIVREHRDIMEEYLGRKLEINEDVHHIDGDKTNNHVQNLMVLTKSEHTKLHWREGKRIYE